MDLVKHLLSLLSRLLMTALFLLSSVNKIMHWTAYQNFMLTKKPYLQFISSLDLLSGKDVVNSGFVLFLLISFELAGGVSLLLGYKTRFGVSMLIALLIFNSCFFHNFWVSEGVLHGTQLMDFVKNCALIGGLLSLGLLGPGRYSLDKK